MITDSEIIEIGKFGKTHGIHGEINAMLDDDVDIESLEKIVVKIDGINVPFFINTLRPRHGETVILSIYDIDTDKGASMFVNCPIYALKSDNVKESEEDSEGMYASDLIGYTIVHADGRPVGKITDINDSTENALFVVKVPHGESVYIPIADELIDEINTDKKYLVMTLPEGILDL
jgi:16S rRNA processing protein RimM